MTAIEQEITNFIKGIAPKIKVTFKTTGNDYDFNKHIINVDPTDKEDLGFLRHLEKVHGYDRTSRYSLLFWSILHEVGHYFTMDDCETDWETRTMLAGISKEQAAKSIRIQNKYFGMEEEWEATEWAIDFVESHKALCNKFNKLLQELSKGE